MKNSGVAIAWLKINKCENISNQNMSRNKADIKFCTRLPCMH